MIASNGEEQDMNVIALVLNSKRKDGWMDCELNNSQKSLWPLERFGEGTYIRTSDDE